MAHLLIGARGNKLALSQSNRVKARLEQLHPGLLVGIEVVEGDHAEPTQETFQADAEAALQARRVDCVLHSLRELPLDLPLEFHLAAITEREEAREALVVRDDWHARIKCLADLPNGARIGVNSAARRAQVLAFMQSAEAPRDWQVLDLFAPLEVRLKQLDAGEVDALIVSAVSLAQLGERGRIAALLEAHEVLPAAGQGALALQTRLEDQRTNLLLEALNHWPTRHATAAERAVLRNLLPSPLSELRPPVAALAQVEAAEAGPQLLVTAMAADDEGKRLVRSECRGPLRQAEMLGGELALDLLHSGARALLQPNAADLYAVVEELFSPLPAPHAATSQPDVAANALSEALPEALPEALQAELPFVPATYALTPASTHGYKTPVFTAPAPEFDLVAAKARKAREQAPLRERHILIARATRNNAELVNALEALGGAVTVCPTVRACDPDSWEALDKALRHLSWHDWLTFASPASVDYFFRRFRALELHPNEIEARRICAVGERTAEKLRAAGVQCDLVLERFTADALAEAVLKRYGIRERLRGKSMLLIASQGLREELRPALDKFGVYVEAVEAYRLALPETGGAAVVAELRAATFAYVIFNGESSVENLAAVLEPTPLPDFLGTARVLCTNDGAREAAQAHGLTVHLQPGEASVGVLAKTLREDCLRQEFDWD